MPPLTSTPTKEKKTPSSCHVGTPTPSLRRGVLQPLGEHNRSRSHSPALGSLSVKDKRTPVRNQKTMLTGVDLTRRFADSIHGPCPPGSPRGSPSLNRIQEGCSSSLGRKGPGTAFKSRLRGGDDTPPVKKAITFSTPSIGKDSIRKHEKAAKRKDLSEHFTEDMAMASLAPKPYLERRDVDSKELNTMLHLEGQSKLSDVPMSKGIGLRGKTSDVVSLRSSMHDKMAMGVGHRSFGAREGRYFIKDAPCRLAFDDFSPQAGSNPPIAQNANSGLEVWQLDRRPGASAAVTSSPSDINNRDESEVMPSPLPCKSPEVCSRGFTMDEEEDNVVQEWFHSRDMACFESFSKGSKTPEAQPSKSPELSKRAMAGSAADVAGPSPQQTPSPQPTSSPEFLKRGSVPPSSGGCFGAGPLMGPEGMRSVKDRRKCKPRGILTIEGEFLFSSGSADFEEVQGKETISVPALASLEWMVADGDDVPESSEKDMVSPGSILEETASIPCHRRCRSAVESGSDQVFWKKGLLYEWNLSLSDQKRAESTPSPLAEEEEETRVSPIGKLRNFSPEVTRLDSPLSNIMGSSLVIGALGSVTNTPSSCRDALDFAGEDEVESKFNEGFDHVKGVLPIENALQELSIDGQAPSLSMSFSLDSPPDSSESWQGTHPSENTAWSSDSWGVYRYKGFNNSQFHVQREQEYTKVESYTRSVFKEAVSPGYSEEGDSVVCTPSSTVTTDLEMPSWKKYCTIGKGEGMVKLDSADLDATSPDLVGISISLSDAPSLDGSSDDFEALRYPQGSLMHQRCEEEMKVKRLVLLHEADYSPSSLLKAEASFRGVTVSCTQPRGC